MSSPGAPPDNAPAASAALPPKVLGPPPLGPVNLALRTESARPAAEESSEGGDVPADAVLGPLRETLANCRPTMQVRPLALAPLPPSPTRCGCSNKTALLSCGGKHGSLAAHWRPRTSLGRGEPPLPGRAAQRQVPSRAHLGASRNKCVMTLGGV